MCLLYVQREQVVIHIVHHVECTVAQKDKPNNGSREGLWVLFAATVGGLRRGDSVGCNLQPNKQMYKGHFHTSKNILYDSEFLYPLHVVVCLQSETEKWH